MTLFLVVLGAIWGLGALFGLPKRMKLWLTAGLFAVILLAHALMPPASPVLGVFGGSLAGWLTLTGVFVIAAAYAWMVGWMRRKAEQRATPPTAEAGRFSTTELNRYARHIVLREVGETGQEALRNARVLVVGAGGLGSPALQYLAAAGVGTIGVIDDDTVSSSNLQRQVIHRDADIGTPKVFSAERAMKALNPFIDVRPYNRRLDEESAAALFAEYDLILEGSDNFGEAVKEITGAGESLRGRLFLWDGLYAEPRVIRTCPRADCPVCGPHHG